MKQCMPEAFRELVENCEILERHYKDMMVLIPIFHFVLLYCSFFWSLHLPSVTILKRILLFVLAPFVSWNRIPRNHKKCISIEVFILQEFIENSNWGEFIILQMLCLLQILQML